MPNENARKKKKKYTIMNKAGSYRFHAKSDRAFFKLGKKGKTHENSYRRINITHDNSLCLYVVFFQIVCRMVKSKTFFKSSRKDE